MCKHNYFDHGAWQISVAQRIKIPQNFKNANTDEDVHYNHAQISHSFKLIESITVN